MEDEIIRKLYINFVGNGEMPRKSYLLNDRIDNTEKELKKRLHKNSKKLFEQMCKDYQELNLMETEEAFINGFSFAVKLLSEAYARKL